MISVRTWQEYPLLNFRDLNAVKKSLSGTLKLFTPT